MPKRKNLVLREKACSPMCKFFKRCPYATLEDKDCYIRGLSEDEQLRFAHLFVEEDGLKEEAVKTLWKMGRNLNISDSEGDARELKMYLEMVIQVARTFKKPPKKEDRKDEPIEINLSTLNPKQIGAEIIPIPVKTEDNDPDSLINSKKLDGILAKRDGKVRKRDENWGR